VQGLEDNRFALISKAHHALVDGVAGVDLVTVLFDLTPVPPPTASEGEPWVPHREPSPVDMAARGVKGLLTTPLQLATRATVLATRPATTLEATREAIEGLGEVAWAALNPGARDAAERADRPAPALVVVRNELSDFRRVKDAFGTTVNDVVLAVVAGAPAHVAASRGVRTEGLELRALVPVSIRTREQHGEMGNRIAAMRGPAARLRRGPGLAPAGGQGGDGRAEALKQAVGAEVLAAAQSLAPPTVLAQASRINFSTRLFNLLVTNVPGPAVPALRARARARGPLPRSPSCPRTMRWRSRSCPTTAAWTSGSSGDYDAMPDLDVVGEAVQSSLAELVDAARAQARTRHGAGAPGGAQVAPRGPVALRSFAYQVMTGWGLDVDTTGRPNAEAATTSTVDLGPDTGMMLST
jgi:hypothetical protein